MGQYYRQMRQIFYIIYIHTLYKHPNSQQTNTYYEKVIVKIYNFQLV
jgi:hypothetical protein